MAGTYSYKIEPRDIDVTRRVRVSTMGELILQAANDDADNLGFGVRDLNLSNASWVLSRLAIEMRRLPQRHEQIDIYTWVSDYGRLVTTRNMTVSDASGAEIGAVVTQWAMIDLETRRPRDLSALSSKGTSLVDREPPIERPAKVGSCSGEERPYEVVYSDIDFNGHVGSMKYVEWMIDTLPVETLSSAENFRLDINYLHEAKLGEKLVICQGEEMALRGRYHFDIRNGDISMCRAKVEMGR